MTGSERQISYRQVDDILVASIRFRGQPDETPGYIAQLKAAAAPCISGGPICLFHGAHPDGGRDIEVCVPVSQPVTRFPKLSNKFSQMIFL